MIHVGVHLQFSQVLSVLEASVIEIERNKTKIHHPEPKDDVDQFIVSKVSFQCSAFLESRHQCFQTGRLVLGEH